MSQYLHWLGLGERHSHQQTPVVLIKKLHFTSVAGQRQHRFQFGTLATHCFSIICCALASGCADLTQFDGQKVVHSETSFRHYRSRVECEKRCVINHLIVCSVEATRVPGIYVKAQRLACVTLHGL